MKGPSIKTVGLSLSFLFATTYVLCVVWDLVFPGWAMYRVWEALFPGFGWSITGFSIGLVESVLYGYYVAVVLVPTYNYLQQREAEAG